VRALVLAALLAAPQAERIGDVEYVKRDTREATADAMRAALSPRMATWGDFWIVGPFPYAGHEHGDLATEWGPEDELERMRWEDGAPDLARAFEGKLGREVRWQNLGPRADERIDLHQSDEPELQDLVAVYLYTTIESPVEQTVTYPMGSDDGMCVWLNGKRLLYADVPRGLDPRGDRVPFHLYPGTNHVLIKVVDGYVDFAFQVLTQKELDERAFAELQWYLDRDFPPSPERAHYRVATVPLVHPERGEPIELEVGGLGFLSDGRAIACTRRGEVWIVAGALADRPFSPEWTLFAEGLHEPLGLAVRQEPDPIAGAPRDVVYCVQRGELTRLVDTDGDDRADRYECASAGWGVSGNYHEFAFGPVFDAEGYAWVTLNVGFCGALGKATVPWRGWALRIAPDGAVEPWADGLRSPNGIARYRGETFYADNQGDYVATNRISHLAKGSWHGHPASLRWREGLSPDERPPRQPASVWLPYKKMGQSVADLAVCPDDRFGPFAGQLFCGDQTLASVMRVTLEQVDGHWQGACYPFLSGLDGGVNRVAFAPDGSLLVGQTDRGWGSIGARRFGLQRVAYTGVVPFEIREMRAAPDGFDLVFTQELDPTTVAGVFTLLSYTYEYHAQYGAPEHDALELDVQATLTGPTTVRLAVTPLRAGYVHELHADGLRSAAGEPLLHAEAYYTLIRVPSAAPSGR
jgi:hypothetical protein